MLGPKTLLVCSIHYGNLSRSLHGPLSPQCTTQCYPDDAMVGIEIHIPSGTGTLHNSRLGVGHANHYTTEHLVPAVAVTECSLFIIIYIVRMIYLWFHSLKLIFATRIQYGGMSFLC